MTSRPPLLIYCQHSLGMGHFVRSMTLARALSECFDVTFLSGGQIPRAVDRREGIDVIALPPVGIGPGGRLVCRDGRRTLENALAERRRLLADTFERVRPRVLIVELFPFGRRKFAGELEPLLARARSGALVDPLVCCSVRDILVGRQDRQPEYDARSARLLAKYFDAVLVHSDGRLARLEDSLDPATQLPVPVFHTGFVHDARTPARFRRRTQPGSIVVSAGGGVVGETLLRTALDAHALLPAGTRRPLTLLTGPLMPDDVHQGIAASAADRPDVRVLRSVPHLAAELAHAAASISQGGYNTTLDLLASRVPALVVPFGDEQEDEQLRRAARLESLGALRVLRPGDATPARLATEMASLPTFEPAEVDIRLDGAERSAQLLSDLVRAGAPCGHALTDFAEHAS